MAEGEIGVIICGSAFTQENMEKQILVPGG